MVCGAEFRAETHALCSRVKIRNTQFPEHYPHMPSKEFKTSKKSISPKKTISLVLAAGTRWLKFVIDRARGQYRTQYMPSRLRRSGMYWTVVPGCLVN